MHFRPLLLLLCFSILGACAKQEPDPQQGQPPEVDVSTPIQAAITQWHEFTGRFEAVNEVEIRARVSGYLDKVNFKDGQKVKKGDVLFVIDQRPFEIALRSAQSRFDFAQKELQRGNDLRRKNSISQQEVDKRLNEFEIARAALENAKLEMEFTEVKSPIDGLASRDLVNVGNLVNGSASNASLLTTVVSISPIHFYFEGGEGVFLKYLRLSERGKWESSRTAPNPVEIRLLDEETFSHKGVMDFLDNRIDQSTGTMQGRAILNNDDEFILPGFFGRIRLLDHENTDALLVPDKIIGTDQSRKFVYFVNDQNQVDRKFVTLGKLHTRELRVIESGLTPDDRIIVNGLMRVRPGSPVRPVDIKISEQYSL